MKAVYCAEAAAATSVRRKNAVRKSAKRLQACGSAASHAELLLNAGLDHEMNSAFDAALQAYADTCQFCAATTDSYKFSTSPETQWLCAKLLMIHNRAKLRKEVLQKRSCATELDCQTLRYGPSPSPPRTRTTSCASAPGSALIKTSLSSAWRPIIDEFAQIVTTKHKSDGLSNRRDSSTSIASTVSQDLTDSPRRTGSIRTDRPPQNGPSAFIADETLALLSKSQRRRLEIAYELWQTEKSHVSKLLVLQNVFYAPLKISRILKDSEIELIFANLHGVISMHQSLDERLQALQENDPCFNIGSFEEALESSFCGDRLQEFIRVCCVFCEKQQLALRVVTVLSERNHSFAKFLADAEARQACQRLKITDLLINEVQRIVKYPLLFENLTKLCEERSDAQAGTTMHRVLEGSKQLAEAVNSAKHQFESRCRTSELQRTLDTSEFDSSTHPMTSEFKHFDLRRYALIHEGTVQWKVRDDLPLVQLYMLLTSEMLILLKPSTNVPDKLMLIPNLSSTGTTVRRIANSFLDLALSPVIEPSENQRPLFFPIMILTQIVVRTCALDEAQFYVISTSKTHVQMLELLAVSLADKILWTNKLNTAIKSANSRATNAEDTTSERLENSLDESTFCFLPENESQLDLIGYGQPETTARASSDNMQTLSHDHLDNDFASFSSSDNEEHQPHPADHLLPEPEPGIVIERNYEKIQTALKTIGYALSEIRAAHKQQLQEEDDDDTIAEADISLTKNMENGAKFAMANAMTMQQSLQLVLQNQRLTASEIVEIFQTVHDIANNVSRLLPSCNGSQAEKQLSEKLENRGPNPESRPGSGCGYPEHEEKLSIKLETDV